MTRKLFLSVLVVPSLCVFAEKDVINKSFNVRPGGTLLMNVDRGSIKVSTANTDKVEIEVTREVKRGTEEEAKEIFEQHQIEFAQDGETVRVEAENTRGNLFNNLGVEYTIKVPAKFDVNLRTAGGNILVGDLDGQGKLQTTGGSLDVGTISGEIEGRTSGGSIKIKGAKKNVTVQTTGGNVTIGNVGGNLKAKTSGGGITLDSVKGAMEANTTGGSIKVGSVGSSIKASSSGGNVSAELADDATGECTLKTVGGSVKVTLPEKIAVDLTASTIGGKVDSDFDGEFNKQRTKLVAKVNGGGREMKLSTSGGNVDIRKK